MRGGNIVGEHTVIFLPETTRLLKSRTRPRAKRFFCARKH
ncbi:MAG: hypothetical protein L6V93_19890 [Clostridiales bacterium]|nr:MAG: hypothetical protein L6V93_19890 [Clostridiales bacterium]